MTLNVAHTATQYSFNITPPDGEHLLVATGDDTIAANVININLAVGPDGALANVGTFFNASGFGIRDGAVTRHKRSTQGTNLSRLPAEVRTALRTAIATTIGDLPDHKNQLDGASGPIR